MFSFSKIVIVVILVNSNNIEAACVLQSTGDTRGQRIRVCGHFLYWKSSPVVGSFSGVFLSHLYFPLHLFASERTNNAKRILHIFVAISLKSSVATRALEKLWRGTGCC